jgi:hypothetical protein
MLGALGDIPDFELPSYANPNQNLPDDYWPRPALPDGCTGFAIAHLAENDLQAPADPKFIYDNTLLIEGGVEGDACELSDAARAGTIYGVRLKGETPEQALTHRLAPPIFVRPTTSDWYTTLLQAVYVMRRPVAVGTSWPEQLEEVGSDGIETFVPTVWVGGHAYCFRGKKTIGGVPRLIAISWNGSNWGDNGRSYFTREEVNAIMGIQGSDALTTHVLTPAELKGLWLNLLIQLQILELVNLLYARLKAHLGAWYIYKGYTPF